MTGIIIAGAGECGVRAAFALRERGFGGAIRLYGDEPHLPYERPPLSKSPAVVAKPIRPQPAYADADIELVRGVAVEAIDRPLSRVRLSDGSEVAYDRLLIATGARARVFAGMQAARTLRTLDDAEAIMAALGRASQLAIIGGGFIGLELASTARALGARVTVVEAAARLMARAVPAAIAARMERRHRDEGVRFLLGTPVRSADARRIILGDGRTVEADIVVAGVGAEPRTELASAAGLKVANGIAVDGKFQTDDPLICAAGDCCSFFWRNRRIRLESWRVAQDQGDHAAGTLLGDDAAYGGVPWFWSDQYDLSLQVAGLPDPDLPFHCRALGDDAEIHFQLGSDGGLVSASGVGPGNAVAKDVRLAEMMMQRGVRPDAERLIDPAVNLKALLRG